MNIFKSIANIFSPNPIRPGKGPYPICVPFRCPRTPPHTTRAVILDDFIHLYGYPSRGGFIVLERATAIHFDFLSLSRIDPPKSRASTPEAEDIFCQRLLLLGAKYFDSEDRYSFMCAVEDGSSRALLDLELGKEMSLTLRERRWVEVAWEADPAEDANAAVWVREWDITLLSILDHENLRPADAARVTLANDMRESCQILKGMGATRYQTLKDYPIDGAVYLRAREWKVEGELKELQQTL